MAGHGCIGCTEPAFWDHMAPLEKPLDEKTLGGGERTIDNIGIALTGAAVAGVAVHAVASVIKYKGKNIFPKNDDRMNTKEEKHD
jgi:Ni,Fe-hydrogenase I small subunit